MTFLKSTSSRGIPLGFHRAHIGPPYLLNGSVVMIPNFSSSATSTSMSSLRCNRAGILVKWCSFVDRRLFNFEVFVDTNIKSKPGRYVFELE